MPPPPGLRPEVDAGSPWAGVCKASGEEWECQPGVQRGQQLTVISWNLIVICFNLPTSKHSSLFKF